MAVGARLDVLVPRRLPACFWAPVGCVACVRQLHAHLLAQLRDAALKPLGGVGGPALLLEGSAALAELLGHS